MKRLFCTVLVMTFLFLNGYAQSGVKVAGMINSEPFLQNDLDVYAADLRAVVAAHYGQKYNLFGMGSDFWDTEYDGGTPRDLMNKLALNVLARNMVLIQEARVRGIDTPRTYNNLEKERAVWNTPTSGIVFGPKTLAPTEYNSYRITGINDKLKTILLQNELVPSEEQLKESFEKLPKEYKMAPYVVSGTRFSWDTGLSSDEEIRVNIEASLQQGISPETIVNNLSASYAGLSQEKFKINSRYISKGDEYKQEMARVLQETAKGSCVLGRKDPPELYYVSKKEGGGYYSFEQAWGLGRNKWINDQFEVFLNEKVSEAQITLFTNTNIAKPIDLSKYTTVTEAQGIGTLQSRGKATSGATTYYIDYNNGNDANGGTTPLQAWKTFKHVNLKTFNSGDHILLEANSIWNGTSADKDNYITQAQQRGNGGMLAPQGNGSEGKPCVIDLYEINETDNGLIVYWSANRRPIINGNGTPSLNSKMPYNMSGTIQLEGQDYWEVRNIEVTNSFDFPKIGTDPSLLQTHWYKLEVPKSLVAMLFTSTPSHNHCKGIIIENCYIHDVQSLHKPRGSTFTYWYKSEHFGTISPRPSSEGGGIWGAFTESVIQGNIIRRVAPIGFHSRQRIPGKKFVFRGNYIEAVAGDAIILEKFVDDNLVESNMIKDACAAPNFGESCYAAAWAANSNRILFQYNEAWGTLYGWWDGEAWDVDQNCDQVIYQYNYSHHNAGGAVLFMDAQTNSIFRYNISANDGGGCRYMEKVVSPGMLSVDPKSDTSKYFNNGQSLIHHAMPHDVAGPKIPLVYNNTFYVGDGVSAAIYGCVWDWPDKYIRFYNNIILKTGAGEVRFSDTHGPNEKMPVIKGILNPKGFKNNLLYAYRTNRKQGDKTTFLTGNFTMDQWITDYGNIWADPKLKIQETGSDTILREQRDDCFPEREYSNSDKLGEYVSINRLRMRASLFTPLDGSPAIETGMRIPAGNSVQEADGAWNGNYGSLSDQPVHWDYSTGMTKDMFGNTINALKPPIGGAAPTYPLGLISCGSGKQNCSFAPGEPWKDDNNKHINAHGGGMLFDNGKYYWFGEHKTEGEEGNIALVGVHCYSSKDLYNWYDEGIVLAVDAENSGSQIEKRCILERPKVIYNKHTKQYVMWFHLEPKNAGYSGALSGVAVSNNVTGPYKFIRAIRPNAGHWPLNVTERHKTGPIPSEAQQYGGGSLPDHPDSLNLLARDMQGGQMARDMNLFVDDDDKAYHIYSSEDNSTLHIALLTDDYTEHSGIYTRNFIGRFMEAPAMFKKDGKYYLMMSGCTGWHPNEARSAVADSILGEWRELGNPCINDTAKTTFGSQSTFILPVPGKKNQYIYMGDRWRPLDAIDGRYIWLPIDFDGERFTIKWKDEWKLN